MAVIILSSGCYPAYPFLFPLSALSIWKTVQLDKMLEQTLPSNMFFQSEPGILENEYFIFLFSTSDPNNIDELDYYIPDSSGRLIFLNIRFTYAMESAKTAMTASMRRFCH